MAATTKNREKHYAAWSKYVRPLRLEPDLSNADHVEAQRALSGFAARVRNGLFSGRQVQAGTASGALTSVGTTIALDRGVNPTKLEGTEKFTPRLGQMIEGWRKSDLGVKKKLPVEVDVPEQMARMGRVACALDMVKAVGDLALIAFYFLLRVGEYTVRGCAGRRSAVVDYSKQTEQFRVRDARFFARSVEGTQLQISPHAPDEAIMSAASATMRL